VVRSSVKTDKLDETAVFGCMCKHEIPKKFCNIRKGGERYVIFGRDVYTYVSCLLHMGQHSISILHTILSPLPSRYDVLEVLAHHGFPVLPCLSTLSL